MSGKDKLREQEKSTRIAVLIIEDNRYMRESWTAILNFESDMQVIATYTDCESALNSGDLENADIILLDIGLPGMSGIDGVKAIRARHSEAAIIMATVYKDDDKIFQSLSNGAIGYLQKNVSASDLTDAVRSAHAGGSPMSPAIARQVIESLIQARPQKESDESSLNERELQVLQLLAEGHTYVEIGKKIFLSVRGVGYYIRSIYRKLEVHNRSEAVREGLRKKLIRMFR